MERRDGALWSTGYFFSWIASPSARNDVRGDGPQGREGTARNDEKGKTRMTGGERLSIT